MIIQDEKELNILKTGSSLLASVLSELEKAAKPGIKTQELDELARDLILKSGAKPAFLGYKPKGAKEGYPATLCVSLNDEIVHGLPSERIIQNGDLVSLDLGLNYKGYFSDMAVTLAMGKIKKREQSLIKTSKDGLDFAIKQIKPGIKTGDLGFLIQSFVEKKGFFVVKELVGHGIGKVPQEFPYLPNWGKRKEGTELKEGMILAVELMISEKETEIETLPDGWTLKTADNSLSSHFEHTIAIRKQGAEILTTIPNS